MGAGTAKCSGEVSVSKAVGHAAHQVKKAFSVYVNINHGASRSNSSPDAEVTDNDR